VPHRIGRLRETLAALQKQLEATEQIDGEARSQIRSAMGEIEAALEASEAGGHQPQIPSSLRERFSDAIGHFKGSHPKLTAAVGRVVDALSDLGI
jgi:hypothetical protein